jgi:hypothetical protein
LSEGIVDRLVKAETHDATVLGVPDATIGRHDNGVYPGFVCLAE